MADFVDYLRDIGEIEALGNTLQTYLLVALVLILGVFVSRGARKLMTRFMPKLAAFTRSDLDDRLVQGAIGPMSAMIMLPACHIAVHLLTLTEAVREFLASSLHVALGVLVTVVLLRSVDVFFRHGIERWALEKHPQMDIQVLAFCRKATKFVLLVVVLVTILQQIGLDVMSLVTGLGIGGLAFALAAQETLGNVLGSLQIMTDRPFRVGDYIRFQGVTGQVLEVGLRSTKMQTINGVRFIIPNKRLAEGTLENLSVHQGITVSFELGLVYETTEDQLRQATELLESIVSAQPTVHEEVRVHFMSFGDFSLNLRVIYFITELATQLDTQHAINLEIKKRFDDAGLSFAFPTQTIHMNPSP